MTKDKTYIDIAILGCILIFCSTFPFALFLKDNLVYICQTALLVTFIIFFCFYTKRYKLLNFEKKSAKNQTFLFFLPAFIACFSNYFTIPFNASIIDNRIDISFIFQALLLLTSVVAEELFFSYLLYKHLPFKKPLIKVVIFASIFALFHLTHFLSSFNPYDLIIVIYSFGIGMVLGLINEYTSSLFYCFLFHLVFNLFNSLIFANIAFVDNYLMYVLINSMVALAIAIYLVCLYLLYLRPLNEKTTN